MSHSAAAVTVMTARRVGKPDHRLRWLPGQQPGTVALREKTP